VQLDSHATNLLDPVASRDYLFLRSFYVHVQQINCLDSSFAYLIKRNDPSGRLVVNLDADMFTSAFFVLAILAPYLKSREVFFFDEFSCPLDEYRACEEFVSLFRVKYKVVGAVSWIHSRLHNNPVMRTRTFPSEIRQFDRSHEGGQSIEELGTSEPVEIDRSEV